MLHMNEFVRAGMQETFHKRFIFTVCFFYIKEVKGQCDMDRGYVISLCLTRIKRAGFFSSSAKKSLLPLRKCV